MDKMRTKTSAEIIRDVKNELYPNMGVRKPAQTCRPETPLYVSSALRTMRHRRNLYSARVKTLELPETEITMNRSRFAVTSDPLPPIGRRWNTGKRCEQRPLSLIATSTTCDGVQEKLGVETNKESHFFCHTAKRAADIRKQSAPNVVLPNHDNLDSLPSSRDSKYDSAYGSRPSSSEPSFNFSDLEKLPQHLSAMLIRLSEVNDMDADQLMTLYEQIIKSVQLVTSPRQRRIIVQFLLTHWNHEVSGAGIVMASVCVIVGITGYRLTCLYDIISSSQFQFNNVPDEILKRFIEELLTACEKAADDRRFSDFETLIALTSVLSDDYIMHNIMIRCKIIRRLKSCLSKCIGAALGTCVLVEITALIRSFLEQSDNFAQVLESDLVSVLIHLFTTYTDSDDLVLNIMRIFSCLTVHVEFCCELLAYEPELLETATKCLTVYSKSTDILVRLLFILGNILPQSEKAQWRFYQYPGFMDSLRVIIHQLTNTQCAYAENPSTVDLLIKLIRLLANLLVHPVVGASLCSDHDLVDRFIQIITWPIENEELVLNCLVALHNLSYSGAVEEELFASHLSISHAIYPYLMSYNVRVVVEAANVLGNLSQKHEIQTWILERKLHIMMLNLLSSSNAELAGAACGILINLTLNSFAAQILTQQHIDKKIMELLDRNCGKNWHLCTLGCKLLWNIVSFGSCDDHIIIRLQNFLLEATDESLTDRSTLLTSKKQLFDSWEDDFCPIATELLDKITISLSSAEDENLLNN